MCEVAGEKKRLSRGVIFFGGNASLFSILNKSRVVAPTNPAAESGENNSSKAAGAETARARDKNFDLNAVSRVIVDEASRLENDAAGWNQKMQQLELDLNRSRQDDEATAKDVDESILVLQTAAGRLGPDAEARIALRKQEGA